MTAPRDDDRHDAREEDRPVIPDRADDDRDEGWGERSERDDDSRFLEDRPPHHDGRSSW